MFTLTITPKVGTPRVESFATLAAAEARAEVEDAYVDTIEVED